MSEGDTPAPQRRANGSGRNWDYQFLSRCSPRVQALIKLESGGVSDTGVHVENRILFAVVGAQICQKGSVLITQTE